jgi:hypothetical protein
VSGRDGICVIGVFVIMWVCYLMLFDE